MQPAGGSVSIVERDAGGARRTGMQLPVRGDSSSHLGWVSVRVNARAPQRRASRPTPGSSRLRRAAKTLPGSISTPLVA